MRTFIAVDPSPDVLARLNAYVERVSKRTKGFSWADSSKIHLTLRFLGDIEETVRKSVADRLNTVCSKEIPILIKARGVGFFPSARKPRIVWAGLEGDIDRLNRLQAVIERVLEGLEVHPCEERDFKPHLTLARIKDFRIASGVASILQGSQEVEFGEFAVKSVFLYKSDLTPKGSRYTKLNEFHLTGDTFHGNP